MDVFCINKRQLAALIAELHNRKIEVVDATKCMVVNTVYVTTDTPVTWRVHQNILSKVARADLRAIQWEEKIAADVKGR